MNLRILWLYFIERIYSSIGKDPMKFKLERYREYGAHIGNNVRSFSSISSSEPYLISIGDNATISTGVRFITHDNSAIKIFEDATDFVGPIKVGNNTFIGANTIILPGVSIADGCIIGAGSLVSKSIVIPNSVACGNPARVISDVSTMKSKYSDKKFDFRGCDRRSEIMSHPEKWINR